MGPLILAALVWAGPAGAAPQDPTGPPVPPGMEDVDDMEGMERARALVQALEQAAGDPERLQAALERAFQAFVEDHDAFRGRAAQTLAEALYAADDANWSAFCLEGISRRLGHYARAEAVLAERAARTTEAAQVLELLERRAILAAGAGWRGRERDLLGAALARGGTDAHQILGRLALAAGENRRARTLFRVLLQRHSGGSGSPADPPPWALRGWGLALLPAREDP